jgi:hypothetical protein
MTSPWSYHHGNLRGLRELLLNLLLQQTREKKRKNLKETSPVMWRRQLS